MCLSISIDSYSYHPELWCRRNALIVNHVIHVVLLFVTEASLPIVLRMRDILRVCGDGYYT